MADESKLSLPVFFLAVSVGFAMLSVPADAEIWEEISRENGTVTHIQSVPDGWLVKTSYGESFQVVHVTDPEHKWQPLRSSPLAPTPGRYIELHDPSGSKISINIMDIVVMKEDPNTATGYTTIVTLRYNGDISVSEQQHEIVNQLQ